MAHADPLTTVNLRRTVQSKQADPRQEQNHAGGFSFVVDDETRLRRFLVLGTTGGTYYQSEPDLTKENASLVIKFAVESPLRLVEILTEVSLAGQAPKLNPTIFALAVAAASPDIVGRKAAFEAMPLVLRTSSHLMLFFRYVQQFRGWGMGLRKAGRRWFEQKSVDALAYQMVKYRNREGFSQRDLLRLLHPKTQDESRNALYQWAVSGSLTEGVPRQVQGFLLAQEAHTTAEWVRLVRDYRLSWEMLPDAALNEPEVWNTLIDSGVPMTALLRQLPRLTRIGVVGSGLSQKASRTAVVIAQITDQDRLQKSRIHPYNVLLAQRTYTSGRSFRGSTSWHPVSAITTALDAAFYRSFGNVVPANKRTMLALDVSGSMTDPVLGGPISCRDASAAMALITMATEPVSEAFAFTSEASSHYWSRSSAFTPLDISPRMRLDSVISRIVHLPFGGTDCALPMVKALELGLEVDTFVVYTDSETWAGKIHPHQALRNYRSKTNIPARLIVVGMASNGFSIADPSDPGMLDVVGFDSAVPNLIADFSRGDI